MGLRMLRLIWTTILCKLSFFDLLCMKVDFVPLHLFKELRLLRLIPGRD